MTASERPLVLLTGASGYVGGRLLKALEDGGVRLRCLARRPDYLRARVTATTELVGGDVLDRASLDAALRDVATAYYLVHSMGSAASFEEKDRAGAHNFAAAARGGSATNHLPGRSGRQQRRTLDAFAKPP
ncbi:MAG: NAD-dependent epimerase/dehydratase family protein [Candidatus Binatus sp.]